MIIIILAVRRWAESRLSGKEGSLLLFVGMIDS